MRLILLAVLLVSCTPSDDQNEVHLRLSAVAPACQAPPEFFLTVQGLDAERPTLAEAPDLPCRWQQDDVLVCDLEPGDVLDYTLRVDLRTMTGAVELEGCEVAYRVTQL